MLQGKDEHHELTWNNFDFSIVSSGKYHGCHIIETVNLLDKTSKVAIEHPECRDYFVISKLLNALIII